MKMFELSVVNAKDAEETFEGYKKKHSGKFSNMQLSFMGVKYSINYITNKRQKKYSHVIAESIDDARRIFRIRSKNSVIIDIRPIRRIYYIYGNKK